MVWCILGECWSSLGKNNPNATKCLTVWMYYIQIDICLLARGTGDCFRIFMWLNYVILGRERGKNWFLNYFLKMLLNHKISNKISAGYWCGFFSRAWSGMREMSLQLCRLGLAEILDMASLGSLHGCPFFICTPCSCTLVENGIEFYKIGDFLQSF